VARWWVWFELTFAVEGGLLKALTAVISERPGKRWQRMTGCSGREQLHKKYRPGRGEAAQCQIGRSDKKFCADQLSVDFPKRGGLIASSPDTCLRFDRIDAQMESTREKACDELDSKLGHCDGIVTRSRAWSPAAETARGVWGYRSGRWGLPKPRHRCREKMLIPEYPRPK
jgi:hypothetical protein